METFRSIFFVISNHPDLKNEVEKFGIRFVHIPVEGSNKREEQKYFSCSKTTVTLL